MSGQIDPELYGVLREIPPLLPKFLQRRRVGLPVVDDLASELGVERPLIFTMVHVDITGGIFGREQVTPGELRAYDPYAVIDRYAAQLEQLTQRGLVRKNGESEFSLSPEARTAVDRLHIEGTAYVARRTILPDEDLERLAVELRRAADAVAANPALPSGPGSHLAGFRALARYGDQTFPMVRIEQAVSELWGARDDAYTRAWREADMEGPPLDLLSHMLSGAVTVSALWEALRHRQTPEDIESSLAWLVEREYVERIDSESVSLTPQGAMVLEDIEHETDRVYFEGWPYSLEQAVWVRDTLSRLVDKLSAPPQQ